MVLTAAYKCMNVRLKGATLSSLVLKKIVMDLGILQGTC